MLEAYNSGKVVEGAFKVEAEGETVTSVYTLSFIESTGVVFSCIDDVFTDTAGSHVTASKVRLSDSDNVMYISVTLDKATN